MSGTPQFKLFNSQGEYVAAAKFLEDAAAFVSVLGDGATVRSGHGKKDTIWTEGDDSADSYELAASKMLERIRARHFDGYKKVYGKPHPEDHRAA